MKTLPSSRSIAVVVIVVLGLCLGATSCGKDSPTSPDTTVYITATGSKYHRGSCSYLSQSKITITLGEAKSRGYTPCSRCDPPK